MLQSLSRKAMIEQKSRAYQFSNCSKSAKKLVTIRLVFLASIRSHHLWILPKLSCWTATLVPRDIWSRSKSTRSLRWIPLSSCSLAYYLMFEDFWLEANLKTSKDPSAQDLKGKLAAIFSFFLHRWMLSQSTCSSSAGMCRMKLRASWMPWEMQRTRLCPST